MQQEQLEAYTKLAKLGRYLLIVLAIALLASLFGQLLLQNIAALLGIQDFAYFTSKIIEGKYLEQLNTLRALLAFSTVYTFLLPALFFHWLYRKYLEPKEKALWNSKRLPEAQPLLLALLLTILSFPLAQGIYALNQAYLPAAWASPPNQLAEALLRMQGLGDFLWNFILVAVFAAIGEEFFFRALLLGLILRAGIRTHRAALFSALAFSFFHFEMQAFLPRLFYGLLFAYFFIYSRSIWLAIAAHALNNGWQLAVLYFQEEESQLLKGGEAEVDYGLLLASLLLTVPGFWLFIQSTKSEKKKQKDL